MEIGNNEIRILEEILTKSVVAGMEAAFDKLDGWASERKEARQALRAKADEMSKESRAVIRKECVFSLGFENSRIVVTLSRLGLVLLLSLAGNFWQMRQNSQLPGNDLIYCHVRMCGEANREKTMDMEIFFTYERGEEEIILIRGRAEAHKRLVKEPEEKVERVCLSISRAYESQNQVESIKQRK